jgi:hypothetical protein
LLVALVDGGLGQLAGDHVTSPTTQRSAQLFLIIIKGKQLGRIANIIGLILGKKTGWVGAGVLDREQTPAQHNETDNKSGNESYERHQAGSSIDDFHFCHLPAYILTEWIC